MHLRTSQLYLKICKKACSSRAVHDCQSPEHVSFPWKSTQKVWRNKSVAIPPTERWEKIPLVLLYEASRYSVHHRDISLQGASSRHLVSLSRFQRSVDINEEDDSKAVSPYETLQVNQESIYNYYYLAVTHLMSYWFLYHTLL